MTVDRIPLHVAVAPSDPRYAELEVEPWPHIHVWDDEEGGYDRPVVKVRLVRWKDWPILTRTAGDRAEIARWTVIVRRPSTLTRIMSLGRVTLASRLEAAIERLEDQWDELGTARDDVLQAVGTYRGPGAEL